MVERQVVRHHGVRPRVERIRHRRGNRVRDVARLQVLHPGEFGRERGRLHVGQVLVAEQRLEPRTAATGVAARLASRREHHFAAVGVFDQIETGTVTTQVDHGRAHDLGRDLHVGGAHTIVYTGERAVDRPQVFVRGGATTRRRRNPQAKYRRQNLLHLCFILLSEPLSF